MEEKQLAWKLVKSEHVLQDKWIDFRKEAYKMPDGTVFEPYYTYSRRSYAVIAARDETGKYLCVRQYRQGIGEVTIEFPAGGIENFGKTDYEKTGKEEDPLAAAKRELLEETGYVSDQWRHLITIPSNATLADNYAHVYFADQCRKVGNQDLDETEFMNVTRRSGTELDELIREGKFQQAIHVMAWLMIKQIL